MENTNNHQAFLSWYEPIHAKFTRYCSSQTYGWMETDDLVQESVLVTLEAFNKVRDKEKLLNFMIGVANNILRNHHRRAKFKANWEEEILEKMESQIGNPEIALDIHLLHQAIDKLPSKSKEALLLFEISGFNIKEVAAIQTASEAAVKTRLSRARKTLKSFFKSDEERSNNTSFSRRMAIYASLF